MNNQRTKQQSSSGETLWSLLSDDGDVSLPYSGTSGWSGTDSSEDRAITADTNGDTKSRQRQTIGHLYLSGTYGLTWKELANMTGWHHGQTSGALSVLHKTGKIARLLEKRGGCRVYVLPEYIDDRETDQQGRQHKCPECGHKF